MACALSNDNIAVNLFILYYNIFTLINDYGIKVTFKYFYCVRINAKETWQTPEDEVTLCDSIIFSIP